METENRWDQETSLFDFWCLFLFCYTVNTNQEFRMKCLRYLLLSLSDRSMAKIVDLRVLTCFFHVSSVSFYLCTDFYSSLPWLLRELKHFSKCPTANVLMPVSLVPPFLLEPRLSPGTRLHSNKPEIRSCLACSRCHWIVSIFFIILDTSDVLHDVTGQANECETGGRNQYNDAWQCTKKRNER